MQRRDLAMLQALGFTPGQVVRMLLAEQFALGLAGTALGPRDGPDRDVAGVGPPRRGDRWSPGLRSPARSRRWVAAGAILIVLDRHGHPRLAGLPGVAGRRRAAEPAGRAPVAGRPALPALPAARRPGPRCARRADQAAARGADRGGRCHSPRHDHHRARRLVHGRRVHHRPRQDRTGRRADRLHGRSTQRRADDSPHRGRPPGQRQLPRCAVRHAAAGRQRHVHRPRDGHHAEPVPVPGGAGTYVRRGERRSPARDSST